MIFFFFWSPLSFDPKIESSARKAARGAPRGESGRELRRRRRGQAGRWRWGAGAVGPCLRPRRRRSAGSRRGGWWWRRSADRPALPTRLASTAVAAKRRHLKIRRVERGKPRREKEEVGERRGRAAFRACQWEEGIGYHGGSDGSQMPAPSGVGLRVQGPPVPQQPVLHGGQGGGLLRGRSRRGLQHPRAQPEILPRAQRRYYQVRGWLVFGGVGFKWREGKAGRHGSPSSLLAAGPGVVEPLGFRAGGRGESWLSAGCCDCYFRGIASKHCSDEIESFFFYFFIIFFCAAPNAKKFQRGDAMGRSWCNNEPSTLLFPALGPRLSRSVALQQAGAVPFTPCTSVL